MGTLVAPDELKRHLITVGTPAQRARGTYLFRRGDAVTGIFLISRGTVRLGLDGDPAGFPSRDVGPGSVVGLPASLSDSSYSLTAEVSEDAELVFSFPAAPARSPAREAGVMLSGYEHPHGRANPDPYCARTRA
jgi:CRP-like cAMP-binding protein